MIHFRYIFISIDHDHRLKRNIQVFSSERVEFNEPALFFFVSIIRI